MGNIRSSFTLSVILSVIDAMSSDDTSVPVGSAQSSAEVILLLFDCCRLDEVLFLEVGLSRDSPVYALDELGM